MNWQQYMEDDSEQVTEPKPTAAFKKPAPEQFERLVKRPNLLILKISKK